MPHPCIQQPVFHSPRDLGNPLRQADRALAGNLCVCALERRKNDSGSDEERRSLGPCALGLALARLSLARSPLLPRARQHL
jgi:hypothetical protein